VLAWMGSNEGNQYVGRQGGAIPAVRSAQSVYFDYWAAKKVDVRPFFAVLNGRQIDAPGGPSFAAGNQVIKPYFDEMFMGRSAVSTTLQRAQQAANSAICR
jgi:multiple sugar transport system substrate-binding protein